jgi:transposase-like protein
MSKRRKFSAEFKRGAVELASQPGSVVPRWPGSRGSVTRC